MAKNLNEKAREELYKNLGYINRLCPTLASTGRNLTKMYLDGKLDKVYNRDSCATAVQKILLRKSKANVLLTGPAGCGKTAIAEHLAAIFAERSIKFFEEQLSAESRYEKEHKKWAKNAVYNDDGSYTEEYLLNEPKKIEITPPMLGNVILYDLSLTALTAGTRYRGDFEERVQNILNECKNQPNIILFIDEIHQIVSSGKCEDSESAAQMLKPALARKDICVIGATTTEEAKYIYKDKALARRFNEVKVAPLKGEEAVQTAKSILLDYSKFHNIGVCPSYASEIVDKLAYFLPNTVFPDNFINVIDETMAGAKFDGLTEIDMNHINATLSRMAGVVIL